VLSSSVTYRPGGPATACHHLPGSDCLSPARLTCSAASRRSAMHCKVRQVQVASISSSCVASQDGLQGSTPPPSTCMCTVQPDMCAQRAPVFQTIIYTTFMPAVSPQTLYIRRLCPAARKITWHLAKHHTCNVAGDNICSTMQVVPCADKHWYLTYCILGMPHDMF
jgi:hypothetical protein